ncbi:MAG: YeeE/YedE thiosulfate transporter family protein [Methanomicrobiaceae archaeon]|nr:YeeE/YedE thiosulfate transporter family protein [Methanomicrobiaceae archaeon]
MGSAPRDRLLKNPSAQLVLGLLMGIAFGFFLQTGGVTRYNVILGQLLLEDFTVVKVMLSAVVVGMLGIHLMYSRGMVGMHPKPGSFGSTIVGGIIFGMGFAILGYCPGTVSGAIGQGSLDALFGGAVGILIGAGLFASLYPWLERAVLTRGEFAYQTIPERLGVNPWIVVLPAAILIVAVLYGIELFGF